MPRPLGGKRTPFRGFDFKSVSVEVARLALPLAALVLALALPPSSARAADDDAADADIATESDSGYDDIGGFAAPAMQGQGAGGLTIEGLMYWRKGLDTVPFTKAGSNTDPYVQFNSTALEGETYAPGMRLSLQAEVLQQAIELSAFYVLPMGLDATKLDLDQDDTDAIYYEDPLGAGGGFNLFNSRDLYGISVHHETKLFGAEANLVEPLGIPGLVLGARAIYFGEQLSETAMKTADDVPWLGTSEARDHAAVRLDNRLLGVQLGLQHMFDVGDVMRIGGSIKGGLYNNFVDRNRTLVAENRVDRSFEATDHDNVFAQGIEINPRVEFKLAEGTYLTAAGQFLWLNNVSTSLQHLPYIGLEDDHDVRADDDVYFYGGSLGLTVLLDESSPISNSLPAFAPAFYDDDMPAADIGEIDARVAELESTTARAGNKRVSVEVSGWINRMLLAWDDGDKKDVYIADNVSSRSRLNFKGAARISRGWSAGYFLSVGLDDQAGNDLDQLVSVGENKLDMRHSAWWLRNSQLGTVTLGHTSTATDNIILKDVGGIMPGAANLATLGGSFLLRRADSYEQGYDALVNSGAYTTTLNDMLIGGSVDTLRRNIIRYDAPRFSGLWGNIDLSAAWGEDDFVDFAVEHGINYNDWKFRVGAGYVHDTDENGRADSERDREEYKGSLSILHIPSGLFGTAAYMRRTFHGSDDSNQAIFGENIVEELNPDRPNRPAADYFYSAVGLRRSYWPIGDTSIYGEYAQVYDSVKGLREADLRGVTESRTMMLGAAICQDIDAAGMDVYAGVRIYSFDTEGIQRRRADEYYVSPAPLTDLMLGYAGTRIKF
jgi:predicted porin